MVSKNLSTQERNHIVQYLLQNLKNGKPRKGVMKEVVTIFNSSKRTVTRLWVAAKKQRENGEQIFLTSAKPNAPRRKRIHVDLELIQSLDLHKRSTIRRLAVRINRSKNIVWRWVNQGLIRANTSAIKPEGDPHRTCKSKSFITRVMFMCAVCRPHFSEDGSVLFEGKIDIFPFTQQFPAQRNSKSKPSGTLETKLIQSVTKDVIKTYLINKILPAIRAKWHTNASKVIIIQQDNAKPHIQDTNPEFKATATEE